MPRRKTAGHRKQGPPCGVLFVPLPTSPDRLKAAQIITAGAAFVNWHFAQNAAPVTTETHRPYTQWLNMHCSQPVTAEYAPPAPDYRYRAGRIEDPRQNTARYRIGRKIAGSMFATRMRSLVQPSRFSAMPIRITPPTADISVTTASLSAEPIQAESSTSAP